MSGIYFYDGSESQKQLDTGVNAVESISAVGLNDAWAICSKEIYHYNGASWEIHYKAKDYLDSVFAEDSSHVWASGLGAIYFYDGAAWSQQYSTSSQIVAIHASDNEHVWAVGSNGDILYGQAK